MLEIERLCRDEGTEYIAVPSEKHEHPDALNHAAGIFTGCTAAFYGFVDHDVFPTKRTRLIPLIAEAGFLTVGQRHAPTGHLYGWPGFFFVSRDWLAGRTLDFGGIRGEHRRDDGDCGSLNWPLFSEEDWSKLWRLDHGYTPVREPDGYGLQSWALERIGDFIHLTNVSGWMQVPRPDEREAAVRAIVAAL